MDRGGERPPHAFCRLPAAHADRPDGHDPDVPRRSARGDRVCVHDGTIPRRTEPDHRGTPVRVRLWRCGRPHADHGGHHPGDARLRDLATLALFTTRRSHHRGGPAHAVSPRPICAGRGPDRGHVVSDISHRPWDHPGICDAGAHRAVRARSDWRRASGRPRCGAPIPRRTRTPSPPKADGRGQRAEGPSPENQNRKASGAPAAPRAAAPAEAGLTRFYTRCTIRWLH